MDDVSDENLIILIVAAVLVLLALVFFVAGCFFCFCRSPDERGGVGRPSPYRSRSSTGTSAVQSAGRSRSATGSRRSGAFHPLIVNALATRPLPKPPGGALRSSRDRGAPNFSRPQPPRPPLGATTYSAMPTLSRSGTFENTGSTMYVPIPQQQEGGRFF